MNNQVSEQVRRIQASPTLALHARASELRAQGKNIINLSVGEPDFDTPSFIKEAAVKAISEGQTKYTPVDGTPALKQAIQEKLVRDQNLYYEPNQIIVSCGAKHAIFNLCMALLNAGDEVIIPSPYWVSYPAIVRLVGGEPVFIKTTIEDRYKINPDHLSSVMTDKTRLLILNTPSNPTGMVYTKKELQALAEVLLRYPHVLIVTDDIYEHILWNHTPYTNILIACPELYDRTIVINGVSKSYSMTGWRIGYAAGPVQLISAIKKVQSQSTSNPCSISQAAATAALKGDQGCVREMVEEFKFRHDYVIEQLRSIEGITLLPSDGTFYTFPNVAEVIERLHGVKNDIDFSEYLINESGVVVVPGSAFGCPNSIRLSFAAEREILKEAVNRIKLSLTT